MNILVVGGGGREHALIWKLRQSPQVQKICCAPGNGGISQIAECHEILASDLSGLVELGKRLRPDLTVVGPEQPLVAGIVDEFSQQGLRIIGPGRASAQLEGSKVFAKQFMDRHGIPTAGVYGVFDSEVDAYGALCAVDWPVVVKADGLAGGKGVLVTSSPDEATAFIERVMEKREFGAAGNRVLLEEGLTGNELSFIVLTDGKNILPLAPSRDYKRVGDGDAGANTGGMGAYSTDALLDRELAARIMRVIVEPTIDGMAREGRAYCGFLYFGLMLTADGPKVLEFNCRLGDPETEALVMRMDFDLADLLTAALSNQLDTIRSLAWRPAASVCAVLAAAGYPGSPKLGARIAGFSQVHGGKAGGREVAGDLAASTVSTAARGGSAVAFHSGTRLDGGNYYVNGGRVLTIAASGVNVGAAREAVTNYIGRISFEGMHFRSDIALQAGSGAARGVQHA